MAELADAYGSGPYGGNFVQVQVLLSAPEKFETVNTMRFRTFFSDKKPCGTTGSGAKGKPT